MEAVVGRILNMPLSQDPIPWFNSVQFSHSVVSEFCNPMDCSTPGFPVHHQLLELA